MSELHWTKGKPDEFRFNGVLRGLPRQPIWYACPACFNAFRRLRWLKPDHSPEGVCPFCQFQRVPSPEVPRTGSKRGFHKENNRLWGRLARIRNEK